MNVTVVLQGLVSVLWVLVVVLIILAVVRASRNLPTRGLLTAIIAVGVSAILLTVVSAGLVFIQPEDRGVVVSAIAPNGYREQPLQPGLSWIVPFFENVVTYPISRQTYTMSQVASEGQVQGDDAISARTSDGQEVFVDASVIYALDPSQVVKVNIEWQDRYAGDLVRPLARGVIRDAISQYGVEQVYSSKRVEMTQQITDQMRAKLEANGLSLVEFILRNITFSPEYAASVEQKQIAEQQAEQAKFTVEQRKQEAEQARQVAKGAADAVVINAQGAADARLIQAGAEAKALELLAAAIKDKTDLLTYTYINKLSPAIQVMLLPNNAPFLFPLPTVGPAAPSATPAPSSILPSILPTPTPTP
jgi:regulator of protease activity HflC (stomatin/prohibitin superfamily)